MYKPLFEHWGDDGGPVKKKQPKGADIGFVCENFLQNFV